MSTVIDTSYATTTNTPFIVSGSTFSAITTPSIIVITDNSLTTATLTTNSLITTTEELINPTNGATTTFATVFPVTDPGVYSSLAAASSHASNTQISTSSKANSSNLKTIVPAVIVPIIFILVAFGVGWFTIKRKRHQGSGARHPQSRYEKAELDTTELPRTHGRAELYGSRGASILSRISRGSKKLPKPKVYELPGSEPPIPELESDTKIRNDVS